MTAHIRGHDSRIYHHRGLEGWRGYSQSLNRYLLDEASPLTFNADGSLTLFAPKRPDKSPESNWLPTPAGEQYDLSFRFYGLAKDVAEGQYVPPPLVKAD